jgi:hypothetical protein
VRDISDFCFYKRLDFCLINHANFVGALRKMLLEKLGKKLNSLQKSRKKN